MERKVKVTRKVSCQLSKVIKLSAKQFVGVFSEVCLLNSDYIFVIRERRKERDRDAEDEEEAYERRKLEKKLREKEAAYQEVDV